MKLSGGNSYLGSRLCKYSTAAAIEEPIKPAVQVEYTQLLIDGKFVDAASGACFFVCLFCESCFLFWLSKKVEE